MLVLSGVSYRYAGYAKPVLHDIDLTLADGEIVGVVGANESGKSTLCLVASGLAPGSIGGALSGGGLSIDGEAMADKPLHEFSTRVGIGFQNPATQLSGVTGSVFEEVALGPMNLGLTQRETVERTKAALATLGIDDLWDREPRRLSGGQGQLVVIASLLAMRPPHLVLDEPTAQLDPEGTRLVGEALRSLAASGTALLIAEHKTDLLDGLCDRVVALDDGRIAFDGPAGTVLEDERLVRARRRPAGPRPGRERARVAWPRSCGGAGMTRLDLEGVGFVYPDGTRALDSVDLTIGPGESVAIVGQNGSGKSTLVRHLNGLLRPTEGRVLHDGEDVAGVRTAALAARVGIVFQNPDRQIFAGKVRTEVAFGPKILGRSGTDVEAATRDALAAVGLSDAADANPYDLGYSRRKLLAIASVLAMGTPVVVLDEPTTGQDARGVARVQQVLANLVADGRTVIAISHDMRFVAESFARIVVMGGGRVLLDGSPAEVFAEAAWPVLASSYLEPPYAARVGARLGLGSTPTETALVEALVARG